MQIIFSTGWHSATLWLRQASRKSHRAEATSWAISTWKVWTTTSCEHVPSSCQSCRPRPQHHAACWQHRGIQIVAKRKQDSKLMRLRRWRIANNFLWKAALTSSNGVTTWTTGISIGATSELIFIGLCVRNKKREGYKKQRDSESNRAHVRRHNRQFRAKPSLHAKPFLRRFLDQSPQPTNDRKLAKPKHIKDKRGTDPVKTYLTCLLLNKWGNDAEHTTTPLRSYLAILQFHLLGHSLSEADLETISYYWHQSGQMFLPWSATRTPLRNV